MTLTLEDIESFIVEAPTLGPLYDKHDECQIDSPEFLELCILAKRGLAAKPRPISEAPKHFVNEPCLVWFIDNPIPEYRGQIDGWHWHECFDDCARNNTTFYMSHFLPISALEKP